MAANNPMREIIISVLESEAEQRRAATRRPNTLELIRHLFGGGSPSQREDIIEKFCCDPQLTDRYLALYRSSRAVFLLMAWCLLIGIVIGVVTLIGWT